MRANGEIGKNFACPHIRYVYGAAPYTTVMVHMPWYGVSVCIFLLDVCMCIYLGLVLHSS